MKKIIISILTVVISAISVGTAAFAWFTLTNTATVQAFEANIISDTGIEVSLDGVNWYTTITSSVIQDYLFGSGQAYYNHKYDAVTTSDGIEFKNLAGTNTSTGYISFKIHFRSDDANQIWLTNMSLDSDGVSFMPSVTFATPKNGLINAIPVGGSPLTGFKGANGTRIQFSTNATFGTHQFAYELSDGTGTGYGENTYLGGGATPTDLTNAAGSVAYYYATTGTYPNGVDSVTLLSTISSLDQDIQHPDQTNYPYATYGTRGYQVITMGGSSTIPTDVVSAKAYYGQTTVTVWLEGWDPDTYNAVLNDLIQVAFIFKSVPDAYVK